MKFLYTREEVFLAHRGRHPMAMRYATGFDRDGHITAVDARTIIDGGAYSSFGLVTTYYSGQLLGAPYRLPAFRFDSTRAYTNKPACGPKRGHGSVQPRFAFESQLDQAAVALGIDPIELRRRNFLGADTRTVNEFAIGSCGFLECLDRVEAASGWKARRPSLPHGRGLGVAGSTYISGTNYCIYPTELPQAAVQITLDRSGRARVFTPGGQTCVAALSSDCAPVLVALDATLVLHGPAGARTVALADYYRADGTAHTGRAVGELATEIRVPLAPGPRRETYVKWTVRRSIDFPLISIALRFDLAADAVTAPIVAARVVVGALASTPRVVRKLEALRGRCLAEPATADTIAAAVAAQCKPLPNLPYDADYRRAVLPVHVRRGLAALVAAERVGA